MAGTKASGGRNARSRATHLLMGTFRGDRHAKTRTPIAPKGKLRPPAGLTGVGRTEWRRMVARLAQLQTLSTVDDAALYQYARLFAETEGIAAARLENTALVKTLLATVDRLVAVAADRDPDAALVNVTEAIAQILKLRTLEAKHTTQSRQGRMAIRQYLVEFGMTPAARTRVQAQPDEAAQAANPLARFTGKASA